jgi:glycosyltransferase involved in cell wall biosynthesis
VILHGADPDEYRFSPEDIDQLRTKLRIDGNRMVLFVGRLEPRKGIDILLYAFAQVLEKVNSILVLVGSGSQASYKALAGQLGIEQHVFFMGYVDDNELRKLYAACDLFVLPSLLEGLGIVILEARAAGKYVVASRIGGIPEVVPVGAGILVPPGKVFPLANGIIQSLCKSHNRLPPVQTWSDVSEQLISFYKTSVGKSSV